MSRLGSQVESVVPATAAGASSSAGAPASGAVVTARLTERADLWGENGKRADSYSSTYRVRRARLPDAVLVRLRCPPSCRICKPIPGDDSSVKPACKIGKGSLNIIEEPAVQVEYTLTPGSDGGWRIAEALVLGS